MRFDYRPTYEERVARWKDWHPWFAWWPVRVGPGDCRWLEIIERRMERYYPQAAIVCGSFWKIQYRARQAHD